MWGYLIPLLVAVGAFPLIWLVLNLHFLAVVFGVCFSLSVATYLVPFLIHAYVFQAQVRDGEERWGGEMGKRERERDRERQRETERETEREREDK
jgi:hypothetical protein